MTTTRVRGIVTGRVQGVNFRWSMAEEADRLHVAGWVRNLPDGRVEFEAEGAAEAVGALVRWAHTGPPSARVDRVYTDRVAARSERGFRIA